MGDKDMTKEGSVSADMVPLTRAGTEEDAGGALLFMCSKAGAYISMLSYYTGQKVVLTDFADGNILVSDGGRMSIVPATY
jgi:hypothetical protein